MARIEIDHADIVVTHKCPIKCKFCIDKFINSSDAVVSVESVDAFLKKIKEYGAKPNLEVLLLGGEPTSAGFDKLAMIAYKIREYGFSPIISTNTRNKLQWDRLVELFDWVQITVHSSDDIQYLKKYAAKVNIKIAGDKAFTLEKMNEFIVDTAWAFQRRSVSMYFTPDFKELCEDQRVWDILNTLDWERNGSYLYAFYKGVRFKRCIHGETNIIDEPTVPKLYPSGVYNKTWCNEFADNYLDAPDDDEDDLVKTLGIGYLEDVISNIESDCKWLQKFKGSLGPEAKNILNKTNSSLKFAQRDVQLLIDTILKEK